MRLDKFLKISRLIKRRSVANTACSQGRVKVNNKVSKPGTDVQEGDIVEIEFGTNNVKVEVLSVAEHVRKAEAKEMYKIL